jgi:hypothetical protein
MLVLNEQGLHRTDSIHALAFASQNCRTQNRRPQICRAPGLGPARRALVDVMAAAALRAKPPVDAAEIEAMKPA